MGKIIYITGGARSGKSTFAENIAIKNYKNRIFIATAVASDSEMKSRIEKHLIQRGSNWKTIESYKDIPFILEKEKLAGKKSDVILLDCLTNMISNLLYDYNINWEKITPKELTIIEKELVIKMKKLLVYIKKGDTDFIIVSNELGMGLVPPYPLGRHFRDIAGRINQLFAKNSNEAYIIVSGLQLKIK